MIEDREAMMEERKVVVEGWPVETGELEWQEYRKKSVVVSAMRMDVPFRVETLEGWVQGRSGDWLIKGVEGELYPCRDSIFRKTYEDLEKLLEKTSVEHTS